MKAMLKFFGVPIEDFVLERPKDISPARFLVNGIFYLEITMMMNQPLVYELYSGKEREYIPVMAMYSACFYLPNMLQVKYPALIPTLTVDLVDELRELRYIHPEIANCALEVVGRHLEPVSGELVIFGIANTSLSDIEREEMGQKLWKLQDKWEPGHMAIEPVKVPDLINSERYWEENNIPALATFINARSFLLLDHLKWSKEDLVVFSLPFIQWKTSQKFQELCRVIHGMAVVNDNAERTIKMMKDYVKTTRSEDGFQRTLLAVDVMRERRGRFKNSNFNNAQLKTAV